MTYIETFSQFIEWIAQFNNGQHLFRGVSKECYKIEASACRRLPTDRDDPSKLLDINKRLIDDARTLGHDLKNGRQLSDLDLLAELQHCGAATCLIDFTHSALVALWFACLQSTEGASNGKVFAVRIDEPGLFEKVTPELVAKQDIGYFFSPDQSQAYQLYQWQPKLQNSRIIAQQSIFLFGGCPIVPVAECVILKDCKQNILTSLSQSSAITEASMFPDFDGFARLHTHNKLDIELDAQGNLQRGIEAYQREDMDTAINYYDKAIELDPDYVDAYCYRGRANFDSDNDEYAIEDFNKAIELDPDYADAYHYRGQALYRSGEIDLATTDLTEARQLRLDIELDAQGNLQRGIEAYQREDMDTAINYYNRAMKLNPDYADAYYYRGRVYYDNNNDADAIEDFNNAIELDPDYADAYHYRGQALYRSGEIDLATTDLTEAQRLRTLGQENSIEPQ